MATGGIRAPEALNFTQVHELWAEWKKKFQRYRTVVELDKKSQAQQISTLIYIMGDEAESIYEQLVYAEGKSKDNYADVLEAFERHFMPRSNHLHYRVQFHSRNQHPGESVDAYIQELHQLAAKCEFTDKEDSLRDRLLSGMSDKQLSVELQLREDLTLPYVIEKMKAKAILVSNIRKEKAVAAVHKTTGFSRSSSYTSNRRQTTPITTSSNQHYAGEHKSQSSAQQRNCKSCKTTHPPRKCPAFGKTCRKCGKKNHFAKACMSRMVNDIQAEPSSLEAPEFFMGAIDFMNDQDNWNVNVLINGVKVLCKVDTGAQCNVIPSVVLRSYFPELPIEKTNVKLTAYTGIRIELVGQVLVQVTHKGGVFDAVFYVAANKNSLPIIGLASVRKLGLIPQCVNAVSVDKYEDVFTGLGRLEGEYKIKLKPNAKPVVCVPRRVPESVKPKLKAELERLESEGVIVKCSEPSEWVNHTVNVVRPNKPIRICLDPKYLNDAILREHFELPRISDIFSRVSKAQVFSTLDATSGFHQVMLDEESSKLTTFITPFGRYRYKRLAFGLSCSPEVYHQKVSQMFDDIEGVETYIDDILVWGETQQQHDERLEKVFERCRTKNFRLNRAKCNINKSAVEFLGHIIGSSGLKVKHDKVDAIRNMLTPKCREDVQRFLGMANYLSKFCPNLAEHTAALRAVAKSKSEFVWEKPQQEAFHKVKELIMHAPTLKLFDPDLDITLTVDASSHSLGAVLLQHNGPVEYAAKSLSDTQRRYAQIEKELLAVLFACQRFHSYVYGRKLVIETDHKPLLGLVKKPIAEATPRLQRILLHLQPYEFQLVYKPGKEMFLADTLSRCCPENTDCIDIPDDPLELACQVIIRSDSLRNLFVEATAADKELCAVTRYTVNRWPDRFKMCHPMAVGYWRVRENISQCNGLLFYNDRLIVPESKRQEVLLKLHDSHLGLTKLMQRAKQVLYWPKMSEDIKSLVLKCTACHEYAIGPKTEPLIPTPVPDYPFQVIGTDLFHADGKDYLVTVDYYSKWIAIDELKGTRSADVIEKLERILCDFGVVEVLRSDNGPQYSSSDFQKFVVRHGIVHKTSSPGYARSNGQVERMVQVAKNLVRKCNAEQKSYYDGLRSLRNTPLSSDIPSPAQLLQGRNLYDGLPVCEYQLFPRAYDRNRVHESMNARVKEMKKQHDKGAKVEHRELKCGEKVRVQIGDVWKCGKVERKCEQPRSYVVRTSDGGTYRRNRRHIRPSSEPDHMFEEEYCTSLDVPGSNQASTETTCAGQCLHEGNYVTRSGRVSRAPDRLSY